MKPHHVEMQPFWVHRKAAKFASHVCMQYFGHRLPCKVVIACMASVIYVPMASLFSSSSVTVPRHTGLSCPFRVHASLRVRNCLS